MPQKTLPRVKITQVLIYKLFINYLLIWIIAILVFLMFLVAHWPDYLDSISPPLVLIFLFLFVLFQKIRIFLVIFSIPFRTFDSRLKYNSSKLFRQVVDCNAMWPQCDQNDVELVPVFDRHLENNLNWDFTHTNRVVIHNLWIH